MNDLLLQYVLYLPLLNFLLLGNPGKEQLHLLSAYYMQRSSHIVSTSIGLIGPN